ncbi:MAG TPA: hypothetical protein VHF87_01130 [Methylomirabilota bacterium]|jgi:hypothetical protein|nr:hypothetical protein [Methylomirabilota bacterium]
MRISLAVFAVVMLGSAGRAGLFNRRLGPPRGWRSGMDAAATLALAVIVIGYLLSRRHLPAARFHRLCVASGAAEIRPDVDDRRLRVGGTALRLASVQQVEAFQPGAGCRVYYLPGPITVLLSAESLSRVVDSKRGPADARPAADERKTASSQIAVVRRGYVIVVLLRVLALGIPLGGVLSGDPPPRLRSLAWIGLFALAGGFVWLALAWLDPGKRRRS